MNRGIKTQLIRASISQNVREGAFCKYSHRDCMQNCLEGYDYCVRHILEDKAAPYRPCAYITKAGRKCQSAAPKLDKKDGFCAFHTKKALIARQRMTRKRRPRETPDSLLEDLVVTTSTMDSQHSIEHRRGKMHSDSIATRALEYASSSDSEAEPLLVEHAWRDSGDSDAESIDSDQEDVLKYAGVYTTEEVAQILRDKLIRLQALYIDQFKRLKHVLLTKRRKYLHAQRKEKELYGSIKRYKDDPVQREKYEKLCAMKRYHKKFGVEALMQRQSTHRRMKVTEGMNHKLPVPAKCNFVDDGLRCNQPIVPLSKFCQKHILHDQNQVLYRPCPFADSQCGRPVPTLLGSQFCSLHQALPPSTSNAGVQEEVKAEGIQDERKPDLKLKEVKCEKGDDYNPPLVSGHKRLPLESQMGIKMEPEDRDTEGDARHSHKGIDVTKDVDDDDDDDNDHVLR